jgi:hypothetical protein
LERFIIKKAVIQCHLRRNSGNNTTATSFYFSDYDVTVFKPGEREREREREREKVGG